MCHVSHLFPLSRLSEWGLRSPYKADQIHLTKTLTSQLGYYSSYTITLSNVPASWMQCLSQTSQPAECSVSTHLPQSTVICNIQRSPRLLLHLAGSHYEPCGASKHTQLIVSCGNAPFEHSFQLLPTAALLMLMQHKQGRRL